MRDGTLDLRGALASGSAGALLDELDGRAERGAHGRRVGDVELRELGVAGPHRFGAPDADRDDRDVGVDFDRAVAFDRRPIPAECQASDRDRVRGIARDRDLTVVGEDAGATDLAEERIGIAALDDTACDRSSRVRERDTGARSDRVGGSGYRGVRDGDGGV